MVSLLLIVKDHRFLFCKRNPNDELYGGHWGLPGGGVDQGETPAEAMVREVDEELGITLTDFRFLKRYKLRTGTLVNLYVHDDPNFDESTIRLNEEHTEYKFFTYYEVEKNESNFVPSNKTFILDYIRTHYSK